MPRSFAIRTLALLPALLAFRALAADIPATPAAAELLEATPFVLDEAVALPDGPTATQGFVLVLSADPGLTQPRQVAMPVPQAGDALAYAASRGGDGVLVALVFGDIDLGSTLLFFGPPEMTDRVDHDARVRRLADAAAAGIRPIGPEAAARALARGSAPLRARRFEDLSPFLMTLRCRIEPDALAAAGTPCEAAP